MRFLILIQSFCFAVIFCQAQNVLSSQGNSLSAGGISIDYSVGEVVIGHEVNDEILATQGFHQPEGVIVISGLNNLLVRDGLQLFPNPVSFELKISLNSLVESYGYRLIDSKGKLVESGTVSRLAPNIKMDHVPSGLYTVVFTDSNQNIISINTVVKI